MSPEERKLLEKTYDLARESNEMIRSMHRSQLIGRFVKIAYWVAIIALSSFALQAIQPYLQGIQDATGVVKKVGNSANSSYLDMIRELTK